MARAARSLFFFNQPSTTEIYTLSLHDALPISPPRPRRRAPPRRVESRCGAGGDRKSTRLNSSHITISYAVFCLKKKTPNTEIVKGNPLCAWKIAETRQSVVTACAKPDLPKERR